MRRKSETRYYELDALRGIAAVMVVLYHFTLDYGPAKQFFSFGNTGVDLFFIISGFVISLTIDNVSKGSHFVVNRVSRLYPAYWTAATFTFAVAASYNLYLGEPVYWKVYFGNLTMFQHYMGIPDLDNSYWTLFVEMQFYAFVLLTYSLGALRQIRVVGISLCALVASVALLFPGLAWIFQEFRLLAFFPLFFAGILFYKITRSEGKIASDYLLVAICLAVQLVISDYGSRQVHHTSYATYAGMLMLYFLAFTAFVNNKMSFLNVGILLFLGKISYTLYLTHQYIGRAHIIPYLTNSLHVNFWVASLLIALPICVLVATLITFAVEIPGNKRFRKFLYRIFDGPVVARQEKVPENNQGGVGWK